MGNHETDGSGELSESALEHGRRLFAGPCDFLLGAVALRTLPEADRAEVAFAGRSNVGKSSLVNALTGRRTLARTSNTPGRTQQVNFFQLGDSGRESLHLVDLPGYGYAAAPKASVEQWTRLVRGYLRGRPNLRRVLLLVDLRRGLGKHDRDMAALLDEAAVSYQVVLTKADKLKASQLEKCILEVAREIKTHVAAHPTPVVTSSVSGEGLAELRARIAMLAAGG
ncbi:MAG: ribosome biogenesis GTP-binding protein YihA/YsxC [Sphingomonadales bacterium]